MKFLNFFKKKKEIIEPYNSLSRKPSHHFNATLKALKNNKVMVVTRGDGIYIRLAGDKNKGEAFRYEFAKVIDFSKNENNV